MTNPPPGSKHNVLVSWQAVRDRFEATSAEFPAITGHGSSRDAAIGSLDSLIALEIRRISADGNRQIAKLAELCGGIANIPPHNFGDTQGKQLFDHGPLGPGPLCVSGCERCRLLVVAEQILLVEDKETIFGGWGADDTATGIFR